VTAVAEGLSTVLAAFARGDLGAAAAGFAEHAVYREARKPALHGRPAIADHFARFASAGPAWEFLVDDVIADGDRACVVYRFRAGEGDGIHRLERAGCALVRLDGRGHVAQWREYEG
jgi:ketosteroid isomerase-like protein